MQTKYKQNKPSFCKKFVLFWITTRMERQKNVFKKTVFIYPTKFYSTCYWSLENLNLERMADSGDDFCHVTNNTVLHISII